jgi:hypothetical protein
MNTLIYITLILLALTSLCMLWYVRCLYETSYTRTSILDLIYEHNGLLRPALYFDFKHVSGRDQRGNRLRHGKAAVNIEGAVSSPVDLVVRQQTHEATMKNLHVALSPLTNTIFCGGLLKGGRTWASNKQDVTGEACAAVAQHVIEHGSPVVVTADGQPIYEIAVRDLRPNTCWPC